MLLLAPSVTLGKIHNRSVDIISFHRKSYYKLTTLLMNTFFEIYLLKVVVVYGLKLKTGDSKRLSSDSFYFPYKLHHSKNSVFFP